MFLVQIPPFSPLRVDPKYVQHFEVSSKSNYKLLTKKRTKKSRENFLIVRKKNQLTLSCIFRVFATNLSFCTFLP